LGEVDLKKLGKELFSDEVMQEYCVNEELRRNFDFKIEVRFKPLVLDNVGEMAQYAVRQLINAPNGLMVRNIRQYLLRGKISESDVKRICNELLANPVIEEYKFWKGSK
jgi:phosphoribosylformylglycinamidine (FGAM) synthase PurS component